MGESRAKYGSKVIKTLSEKLQKEFGKGFSEDLQLMRMPVWKHEVLCNKRNFTLDPAVIRFDCNKH